MGHIEPVRVQLMTLSMVVVTKPFSVTPSMLMRIPFADSFPFEGTLLPLVDKTDHEDGEEEQHREEAERADFMEHDRPGKQEGDLQVEQDEQDRHQVVAHVEFHARVL